MPHTNEGNQSVLSRVGQGLLAFGADRTFSSISKERAGRDIAESQAELGQQQVEAGEAETSRRQRQQELTNAAFSGGPESDRAAAQLSVEFPEVFENISESMGLRSQGQKNEAADFALRLRNTPFDQRQPMIDERVNTLSAAGRDAQHTASLAGQSEEDQNNALRVTELLALSPEERMNQARGVGLPAEERAFESLISDFTPAEQTMARRVKAGLEARAGISAPERIAGDPSLTTAIAESQAEIREAGKFAEFTGASRAKAIDAGFESIVKIDANIRNLDKAIDALDKGAETGAIFARFSPTIREQSVILQQVQSALGLDVVQSVSFGALSEGELNLAMSTALPTSLDEPALRQWILARQAAQRKLRGYLSEQIQFLDQGGTIAGFLRQKARDTGPGSAPTDTGQVTQADLDAMTPEERALFEQ